MDEERGHDPTKEEIILQAAMDVFVEKGWNGARMQEIADRAKINKALLHYYFRSKENLYDRIIETVFTFFFRQIEEALQAEDSFELVLRHFINAIVETIAANPRIPQFVMHELSQGGKNAMRILTDVIGKGGITLPQRMYALVRRELDAGRIRPVNPPQLIITILGACIYYFVMEPIVSTVIAHVEPGAAYDRRSFIAERKESIFDVVYYGIKKR